MGDDEDIDSDGHGSGLASQTIVYEQNHAVFGLPPTPRINQRHRRAVLTAILAEWSTPPALVSLS